MIHPSDPQPAWPRGTASVAGGPVTCIACGCRLTNEGPAGSSSWTHFSPLGGRDARGCRVACVGLPHDASGRALFSVSA
jgi:hypothetical protein